MEGEDPRIVNIPGIGLQFLQSATLSDEIAEIKRNLQEGIGLSSVLENESETNRRVTVETLSIPDLMAETAATGINNPDILLAMCSRLHSRRRISDNRTFAQHALSIVPTCSVDQLERAVRCEPVPPGVRLQLADVLTFGLLGAKRDWERGNRLYEEASRLDNDPEAMVDYAVISICELVRRQPGEWQGTQHALQVFVASVRNPEFAAAVRHTRLLEQAVNLLGCAADNGWVAPITVVRPASRIPIPCSS